MSHIFTPPGTSAREGEQQRQSNANGQLAGLLPGEVGYQKQLQGFRSSQLPNMEQGVQNAYTNTTQGGRNAETDAYGAEQQAMAREAQGQAGSKFAGNPGLATGYSLDATNQANDNTGKYAAELNSPAGENSAWSAYMGRDAALAPSYSGADSITGTIDGQPPVQVGQGLGGFLGSALGSWATGGFPGISSTVGNIFGGGGGDSSYSNVQTPSTIQVGQTLGSNPWF